MSEPKDITEAIIIDLQGAAKILHDLPYEEATLRQIEASLRAAADKVKRQADEKAKENRKGRFWLW